MELIAEIHGNENIIFKRGNSQNINITTENINFYPISLTITTGYELPVINTNKYKQ